MDMSEAVMNCPENKFVVISENDIFGQKRLRKKKKKKYEGSKISSFNELKVGDYVVHENHGLGIYKGIEKVEIDKVLKDYVKIEYARRWQPFRACRHSLMQFRSMQVSMQNLLSLTGLAAKSGLRQERKYRLQ